MKFELTTNLFYVDLLVFKTLYFNGSDYLQYMLLLSVFSFIISIKYILSIVSV